MQQLIQRWMLCGLLFSATVYADIQQPIPIFRVDAHTANPTEIGIALGEQVKAQFPDVEHIYDHYLAQLISQGQFESWNQQANALKLQVHQRYQEEVQGVASTWTITQHDQLGDGLLSLNELWLLQLLPDVGHTMYSSGFGVWGQASSANAPIIGRNINGYLPPNARPLQAITVYDYGHSSVVNIGLAGYVGMVTGFNSQGLFVAHLSAPVGYGATEMPQGARAIGFDLRWVLQSQTRVSGAAYFLISKLYPASHNILLGDAQHVQVLEQPVGQAAGLRTDNSELNPMLTWGKPQQIAVVNCFALRSSPANCNDTTNTFRWYRFKQLARFDRTHPAQATDVSEIMFDASNVRQAIFNEQTLQSMVFNAQDKKLYLYTQPEQGLTVDALPSRYEITHLFNSSTQQAPSFLNISLARALLIFVSVLLVVVLIYGEYPRFKKWLANIKH